VADGVDRDQEAHDVVIDRKNLFVFSLVQGDFLVIFHVLKNKNILAAYAVKDFSLEFAVHEPGKAGLYLEIGCAEFRHVAPNADIGGFQIIIEIDLFHEPGALDLISFCQNVAFLAETPTIDMIQVLDGLVREFLTAWAGENRKIRWL
jgi:hypothetical protein